MAKSLDANEVTVIRPDGTVSPMDRSYGARDDNDWYNSGGHDHGYDDNDWPS